MNILHIINNISHVQGGGAAVVVCKLAKYQAKLGHEVTIYSTSNHVNGLKPPPGVELKIFKSISKYEFPPGLMLADFSRFDILHLHNCLTPINLIAAVKGKPFVLQAQGSAPVGSDWRIKQLPKMVTRRVLLDRASLLIADAEMEVEQYHSRGVPLAKIREISLGIDLDDYADLPLRHKGKIKTLLYLARYHPIKGPDILINAFKLLNRNDVRLVMYGWDHGYREQIDNMIIDMGLQGRIQVNGYIDGRDKLQVFRDADIWVSPSRYEMFGLGVLEALACGTPIIITDRYAIANKIPGYCGDVVPCTSEHLAVAIHQMLNAGFADRHREERQQFVKRYSWDVIATEIVNIYKEVLTERCLVR